MDNLLEDLHKIMSLWLAILTSTVLLAQGSDGSIWMTRSVQDYRRTPFRDPPPLDFHPDLGYRQEFGHQDPFANSNMIPTSPPSFFEFFDPVSGAHHKIHNNDYNMPTVHPQEYSSSYKLQDASTFPSSYDKKRHHNSFSAPHENSYVNDNQFYSDFATNRRKSFQDNPQYSGPISNGNGYNDNFVFHLLSNWKDYRLL